MGQAVRAQLIQGLLTDLQQVVRSLFVKRYYTKCYATQHMNMYSTCTIEIIDIECVLLSLLSKNFVATKWRIYKGILASPGLLRREFCAVARSAIVFFFVKQSLQKDKNS